MFQAGNYMEDRHAKQTIPAGRYSHQATTSRHLHQSRGINRGNNRALGVRKVTYYRWRKKYGGMNTTQVKRLQGKSHALRQANRPLRAVIAAEATTVAPLTIDHGNRAAAGQPLPHDGVELAGAGAETAPVAQGLIDLGRIFPASQGLDLHGQGAQPQTLPVCTVADGPDEGSDHGPDGMDRPLCFQHLHLGDGLGPAHGLEPCRRGLAEIPHVQAVVPGLRRVTQGIAATLLSFVRRPTAGARHTDDGGGLGDDQPDILDGDHLAEMFLFGLGHHGAYQPLRQSFLLAVDELKAAQAGDPLANGRFQKVMDIIPAPQIGQQVTGVVFGIFVPDSAIAMSCTEITHFRISTAELIGGGQ